MFFFFGKLKTSKIHSQINWPLRAYCPNIYILWEAHLSGLLLIMLRCSQFRRKGQKFYSVVQTQNLAGLNCESHLSECIFCLNQQYFRLLQEFATKTAMKFWFWLLTKKLSTFFTIILQIFGEILHRIWGDFSVNFGGNFWGDFLGNFWGDLSGLFLIMLRCSQFS